MRIDLNQDEILQLAARLARGSDNEQAAFLSVFARELFACCETTFKADTQMAHVFNLLDKDGQRLAEFFGAVAQTE
jgi:hypothetical protein